MKQSKLHIPQRFDYDSLVKKYPPTFKINRDKTMYLLSLIPLIRSLDHSRYSIGAVPMHSTLVQQAGIRDFPKYRDWLIEAGVWKTDNQYIVGKNARKFRFTEDYSGKLQVATIQKNTLIKKISTPSKEQLESIEKYPHLYQWFDGLEIDEAGAAQFLDNFYGEKIGHHEMELEEGRGGGGWIRFDNPKERIVLRSQLYSEAINAYNSSQINIDRIKNKDFFFKVDSSASRLHTNLTNIKSELRNFITYKGQKLVSIDIKNSQPLMLTLLLNPNFWKPMDNSWNNTIYRYGDIYSLFNISFFSSISSSLLSSPSLIMLAELTQSIYNKEYTIDFINSVSKGRIYEYMEEKLKEVSPTSLKYIHSRKDLKALMFTVLFTDNRFIGQKEAEPKRLFKQLFSSVYEVASAVKKKNSRTLPILLQNIESKLILDTVAARIMNERPSLPIFTIHDSVATTRGNEDYVQKVMKEEIEKRIGISPSLSVEYWDSAGILKKKYDSVLKP